MKSYKFLILLFVAMNSLATYSQFSIDIYSGYNHAKSTHEFPNNYNYNYHEAYYTGNVLDTIYGSDTTIFRYEMISDIFEHGVTAHSFTPKKILGINTAYTYFKFFRTGVSFEKHGITSSESYFSVDRYSHIYSHESMVADSIITFFEECIDVNYQIYCASLIQSFIFPYKRLTFASNFEIVSNYYHIESIFSGNINSVEHPIYHSYSSNSSKIYKNIYSGKSIGFKTSLSIYLQLFNDISAFGNVGYSWSNLNFQKGQQMYYYYESANSFGVSESVSRPEPQEIAVEDIPFGAINYNSWNFRLGLKYTFNSKQSNDK